MDFIELGIWHTFRTLRSLDLVELAHATNLSCHVSLIGQISAVSPFESSPEPAAKILGMGAGVQAVKQKLISVFGSIDFREMYDPNADSTLLAFQSGGQIYSVRISRDFDDDFLSGTTVSLWNLVTVLKASQDKKVIVKTSGISEA